MSTGTGHPRATRISLVAASLLFAAAAAPLAAQNGGADDSTSLASAQRPDTLAQPADASQQQSRARADSLAYAHCRRCLGGHRFLVSSLVPDPFITTHFRSGIGAGTVANLTIAVRNIEGQVIDSLSGTIGAFVLDFDYQYAFNKWIAVHGTLNGLARTGTNAESVLASGASALYGIDFGVIGRVWGNDVAQVSLTADAIRNQVWVIDPYRFAQEIATTGDTAAARKLLVRAETTNRYTGGVRGAWAPWPWLGLHGLYELGAGKDPRPGHEKTKSLNLYGALAGFDMRPLWRVPVGLSLGWRGQSGPGRVTDVSGAATTWTGGVWYTGRPTYLIGAETTVSRINIGESGVSKIDLAAFRLITRFDF